MRSTVAGHGKLTTRNWEDHQSWSSYKEVAKELNVNHLMVIQHLMQTGKVKNLSKWVPHELTENQKHCHFEVTSLILCNNKEPFLDWIVMYNEKCTLYNNWWWPSQCLDWKEAPKHFPKPNLNQKKVMVTVWWSAASLIHYSFLNSSATITSEKYAQQIKETHWKLQHLQPTLVTREGPVLFHDNVRPHVTQPISASWGLLRFMSIGLVMPSNHLILCRSLFYLPSIFSQHQGLLQWVSFLHQVAKVLELQLQHQLP